MNDDTWQHAELVPPPDGPQARARGEVTVVSSDGGITVEVTVRQLSLPRGAEVVLSSGDRELTRFMVAGGSGSHSHTLDHGQERAIAEGAEVVLRRPDETGGTLLRGTLRETHGAS